MAFKMKGGKDPMKKNFPDLTGDGEVTQADILKGRGVFKMKKDNAPMMRMDPSAMKAMGKPAPVKKLTEILPKLENKIKIKQKPTVDLPRLRNKVTLKKNKSQKDLEKKRELGYNPKSREEMDYIPQSQRKG